MPRITSRIVLMLLILSFFGSSLKFYPVESASRTLTADNSGEGTHGLLGRSSDTTHQDGGQCSDADFHHDYYGDYLNPECASGEVLVKFKPSISVKRSDGLLATGLESINELNRRFRVIEMSKVFWNVYMLRFSESLDVFSVAKEYASNPNVECAEPNYIYHECVVPNDANYTLQWAHKVIESERAWDIETGDPDIVIAILDTGVDWDHPDLAANIWNNTDEVIDGLDNDGNGYIDDVRGYDFVNTTNPVWPGEDGIDPDNDPMDFHGHGTHCAGIAAAATNNGIGIAGVSWNCKIMPLRAGYKSDAGGGNFETENVVAAIVYAADNGAKMISMSWGGYEYDALLHEAVKYAYDRDVLMVAAAGNEETSLELYPAAFDEVVAVTATRSDDKPAQFTNFGGWVEIAAPGVGILSTIWNDSYRYADGTSMSTPHVAGVAALIWSHFPRMSRDWVRLQLRYTTDDLGDLGFDDYYGYGRVNARKAVEQIQPHDLLISDWQRPLYVNPGKLGLVNTTVLNFGTSDENGVSVRLVVNGSVVASTIIQFLASGATATVSCPWRPTVEGTYNITSHVVPVAGETVTENNFISAYVYVGFPVKALVVDSAGTDLAGIQTWQELNTKWYMFGKKMIFIDYSTLNKENITYQDLTATGADVLIISCAFSPTYQWEFTDTEVEAIKKYVYEGHGLIATAGTLYYQVPNNNKLAPLFGLRDSIEWKATDTDLLHLLDPTHPLFAGIPNPYTLPKVVSVLPSDGRWDSNELSMGAYVALGHFLESAVVLFRGLVYISPWLEIIPSHYHFHLQLLYNALAWSRYQRPQHDLEASLKTPARLKPGESATLKMIVSNMGVGDETNIEMRLLIDGILIEQAKIQRLPAGSSYTVEHLWIPTIQAAYNVTAYAPPVSGEDYTVNNIDEKMVIVIAIYVKNVLVYTDDPNVWPSLRYPIVALDNLEINYTHYADNPSRFGTALTSQTWDLVVVDHYNFYTLGEYWTELEAYVRYGGLLILSTFDIDGSHSEPTTLWGTLGVKWVSDMPNPGPVYRWIPTHSIFTFPNTIGDLTSFAGGYYDSGDHVAATTGTPIAGFTKSPVADHAAIVLGNAYKTLLMSFCLADFRYDQDVDGKLDAVELWENAIIYLSMPPEHDLATSLDAPWRLSPGDSALINATVQNQGLSDETNVELFLLINGSLVNSIIIPVLSKGSSYTISYPWLPTIEAIYNITAYAPPNPSENITANNFVTTMIRVRHLPPLALISDNSELSAVTGILDSLAIAYDIYDNNRIDLYTANLGLLLTYKTVIFNNHNREITQSEHAALESYLSSGGNLLVTGKDSLGDPSDPLLAEVVCSSTTGDNIDEPDLYVANATHSIMNGPYGSFPAGYHISWLYDDCDKAEANTERSAITVAELADGYDKIIATEGLPGKVVYWNGRGEDDWSTNADCEGMFKNTLFWFGIKRYEHDLMVSLQAPDFFLVGESSPLKATVHNWGLNNETNVKLFMVINGTSVGDATVPKLAIGCSYTLTYVWTPMDEGTYNLTAYAPPTEDEIQTANNIAARTVSVTSFVGPAVRIDPRQLQVDLGELFTVNIVVINISEPGLYCWEFSLYYPNDILNATEIVEGPFLKAGGNTVWVPEADTSPPGIINNHNATHGKILVACSLLGDIPGVTGNGVIATVTFNCTRLGTAPLHFGHVILFDGSGLEIPRENYAVVDGVVFAGLGPTVPGDLNHDGVVNIPDLYIAAKAWGSYPGHPRWNSAADLDGNGIINIIDIMKIAKNFGKTS